MGADANGCSRCVIRSGPAAASVTRATVVLRFTQAVYGPTGSGCCSIEHCGRLPCVFGDDVDGLAWDCLPVRRKDLAVRGGVWCMTVPIRTPKREIRAEHMAGLFVSRPLQLSRPSLTLSPEGDGLSAPEHNGAGVRSCGVVAASNSAGVWSPRAMRSSSRPPAPATAWRFRITVKTTGHPCSKRRARASTASCSRCGLGRRIPRSSPSIRASASPRSPKRREDPPLISSHLRAGCDPDLARAAIYFPDKAPSQHQSRQQPVQLGQMMQAISLSTPHIESLEWRSCFDWPG
jgi:hypothetical protein